MHMVEIYMEKINDLLIHKADRKDSLKIRDNKGDVYIEGVVKKPVDSFKAIA